MPAGWLAPSLKSCYGAVTTVAFSRWYLSYHRGGYRHETELRGMIGFTRSRILGSASVVLFFGFEELVVAFC